MYKPKTKETTLIIVAIVVGALLFVVYNLHPALSDFRNSIWGALIRFLLICALIWFMTRSKHPQIPLWGKLTAWGYALVNLVCAFINFGRAELLLYFVYAVVNFAVCIYLNIKINKNNKSSKQKDVGIWVFGMLAFLTSFVITSRAEYLLTDFPFGLASLVIAVFVAIGALIISILLYKKDKNTTKLIVSPLIALFIAFLFSWATITSMNIYLDTSEPTYQEYVIVDKDIDSGARQITTYNFKVELNGKTFEIGVSEEDYYDYEVNDTIILSTYNGAFNEPYVIYDN